MDIKHRTRILPSVSIILMGLTATFTLVGDPCDLQLTIVLSEGWMNTDKNFSNKIVILVSRNQSRVIITTHLIPRCEV